MNLLTRIIFSFCLLINIGLICNAQKTEVVESTTLDFRDQPHLFFDAIYNDIYPKLIKVFEPVYLNITEDHHYDAYLTHMGVRKARRPRFIRLKIVSHKFDTVPTEDVSMICLP